MSTKIKRTLLARLNEKPQLTNDPFFDKVRDIPQKKPTILSKIAHSLGKHVFGRTDQELDNVFGQLWNVADIKTASKLQAIYKFIDFMWRRSKLQKTTKQQNKKTMILTAQGSSDITITVDQTASNPSITISVVHSGDKHEIIFYPTTIPSSQKLPPLSELKSNFLKPYVKNRKKDVNKIYSGILEFVKTVVLQQKFQTKSSRPAAVRMTRSTQPDDWSDLESL